jgi:hypothetical protein
MARIIMGVILAGVLATSAMAQNRVVTPGVGDTQFSPGTQFWSLWQAVTAGEPTFRLHQVRCDPRPSHQPHRSHRRSDRCIRP